MNIEPQKRWIIAELFPDEFRENLAGYPQILLQLLYNRGIRSFDEADIYLSQQGSLYDPFQLTGMEVSVNHILSAIHTGKSITVYGDYDVDGITATVLLVQVVQRLGGSVDHYIPNRYDEGYGLSMDGLSSLKERGANLIITVDCGIRSPKEAAYAAEIGLDLIISDHHSPKATLPQALAVINPKQAGDLYPYKELAGVGLAYKIAEALFHKTGLPDSTANEWLDLVAVGTVADIVPLTGENRSMVRAGLHQIREARRLGLRSLMGIASKVNQNVSARDIGFVIGPRLNAAGRMESAEKSYQLLMADNDNEAGNLAQQLDDLNKKRQDETTNIIKMFEDIVKEEEHKHLLFFVTPEAEFSMGLVGLAAARLTEKYYLPSIIGSQGEVFTRASCRSITEFHITRALDMCADLLERHGGHAMAAGFTIRNENLEILKQRLYEIAQKQLPVRLHPPLHIDLRISLDDLRRHNAIRFLDAIEPVGMDNTEALFLSENLRVMQCRAVGSEGRHLKLAIKDDKNVIYDAIAFRQGQWEEQIRSHIKEGKPIDIVYGYERNLYHGRETLQLNIRDLRTFNGDILNDIPRIPS